MNLNKVTTLFHQFSALNAVRLLCAELTQKIFDPHCLLSYSQTGEDRILNSILDEAGNSILSETGFYVEVGCNHPQSYSNTFALYRKGWTGITIDANKNLIQKHQHLRRQDQSICAVISNKEQEVVFTDFEDSLVSSLDDEHINKWQEWRKVKEKRVVSTISLNTILSKHEAQKFFDLLCIDVEGHDFEVLCSLDLNTYRPKVIVIEMHDFDMLNQPQVEFMST